jgi:Raf kinase inhibitor-like YbhB/YbcL family protein
MKLKIVVVSIVISVLLFFIANSLFARDKKKEVVTVELEVKSSEFSQGGAIPGKHTCDGEDVSPPLRWSQGPRETKSYALICDDPDAPVGTWVHWVVYNIPVRVTSLDEDIPKTKSLRNGALQGVNDFKRYGYDGPCPPGGTHRYFFKLYALDTVIDAKPGLNKKKLLQEMEGHILAQGALMGKYSR